MRGRSSPNGQDMKRIERLPGRRKRLCCMGLGEKKHQFEYDIFHTEKTFSSFELANVNAVGCTRDVRRTSIALATMLSFSKTSRALSEGELPSPTGRGNVRFVRNGSPMSVSGHPAPYFVSKCFSACNIFRSSLWISLRRPDRESVQMPLLHGALSSRSKRETFSRPWEFFPRIDHSLPLDLASAIADDSSGRNDSGESRCRNK